MRAYRLKNPICAVVLNHRAQRAQLPAASILRWIESAMDLTGLVNVECKGQRYAIFHQDLNEYGELVLAKSE